MDKYTFVEKIGEGSYAVVYRATAADGTQVAIKALKDDFDEYVVQHWSSGLPAHNALADAAFSKSRSCQKLSSWGAGKTLLWCACTKWSKWLPKSSWCSTIAPVTCTKQ